MTSEPTLESALDALSVKLDEHSPCPVCREGQLRRSERLFGWAWCSTCGSALECGDV